jgi:hypothetical protein
MFFFEKKNQKTFAPWRARALARQDVRWRERRSESFLLLFFKKEGLPCFHVFRGRAR